MMVSLEAGPVFDVGFTYTLNTQKEKKQCKKNVNCATPNTNQMV